MGGPEEEPSQKKVKDDCAVFAMTCQEKGKMNNQKSVASIPRITVELTRSLADYVASVSLGQEQVTRESTRALESNVTKLINCLCFQDDSHRKFLQDNFNLFLLEFKNFSKVLLEETDMNRIKKERSYVLCKDHLFQIGEYMDTSIFQ